MDNDSIFSNFKRVEDSSVELVKSFSRKVEDCIRHVDHTEVFKDDFDSGFLDVGVRTHSLDMEFSIIVFECKESEHINANFSRESLVDNIVASLFHVDGGSDRVVGRGKFFNEDSRGDNSRVSFVAVVSELDVQVSELEGSEQVDFSPVLFVSIGED